MSALSGVVIFGTDTAYEDTAYDKDEEEMIKAGGEYEKE
jgi:hypothetical protein